MKKNPVLIGIGGAHVDRRGIMTEPYIRGASIPGKMHEEVGGGMFNALRTAAQFGIAPVLLSARGGDSAGEAVATEAASRNIRDISAVFLDRSTASYTALLDESGDVIAALADMAIYETALPRTLARKQVRMEIGAADGVLVDANLPEQAVRKIADACVGKKLYALAISPAKVVRLRHVMASISCLFLNKREAKALCGHVPDQPVEAGTMAYELAQMGLNSCIMTDGPDKVLLMENQAITTMLPPVAETIADVTGAGDALCGATVASLLKGMPFIDASKTGLAAASMTVESPHAVADFKSADCLGMRIARVITVS